MSNNNDETSIGGIIGIIVSAIIGVVALVVMFSAFYTVPVGYRGVLVTLGKADESVKLEGLGVKLPWISGVEKINVRQQSWNIKAPCFSSDLQTVTVNVIVLFRIPERNVVKLYKEYRADVFQAFVAPKTQEALKEVTALKTAEQIVKIREVVKIATLDALRTKVLGLVEIDDIVLENIDLSPDLEKAIEKKMVQEQDALKAKFTQEQARIDAETAKIRAQGEADAIRIRSEALDKNPRIINLMIAEKWNGVTPLVVGAGEGSNVLLPIGDKK